MLISLPKKNVPSVIENVPSVIAMTLTMVTLMIPADAQTVSCTPTSPECCWVIRSWQKMGNTTSASPFSATACCNTLVSSTGTKTTQNSGIPGVNCTSTGNVTQITWGDLWLRGPIPIEIGNLKNLVEL
jgi:hypothetical protein